LQGAPGISGLQYVTGTGVIIGKLSTGTATASCSSGRTVIAGGYGTTVPGNSGGNPAFMQIFKSANNGTTIWSVTGTNSASGNGNLNLTLTAYAVCAIVQ
jgi:hypothetical protein